MRLTLSTTVKASVAKLNRIERRQIPFATSRALNDLAFEYRKHVIERVWPRSVNVKQRNFARAAFRVEKSNKQRLRSAVFDSLNRAFLPRQITGGIKTPFSSSKLAIPTRHALTASGRIKKAARLANAVNVFRATINGQDGIWQRHGRGRRNVRLLYVLADSASVPKAFPFYRAGERFALRRFSRMYDKRLRQALATAR